MAATPVHYWIEGVTREDRPEELALSGENVTEQDMFTALAREREGLFVAKYFNGRVYASARPGVALPQHEGVILVKLSVRPPEPPTVAKQQDGAGLMSLPDELLMLMIDWSLPNKGEGDERVAAWASCSTAPSDKIAAPRAIGILLWAAVNQRLRGLAKDAALWRNTWMTTTLAVGMFLPHGFQGLHVCRDASLDASFADGEAVDEIEARYTKQVARFDHRRYDLPFVTDLVYFDTPARDRLWRGPWGKVVTLRAENKECKIPKRYVLRVPNTDLTAMHLTYSKGLGDWLCTAPRLRYLFMHVTVSRCRHLLDFLPVSIEGVVIELIDISETEIPTEPREGEGLLLPNLTEFRLENITSGFGNHMQLSGLAKRAPNMKRVACFHPQQLVGAEWTLDSLHVNDRQADHATWATAIVNVRTRELQWGNAMTEMRAWPQGLRTLIIDHYAAAPTAAVKLHLESLPESVTEIQLHGRTYYDERGQLRPRGWKTSPLEYPNLGGLRLQRFTAFAGAEQ